MTLSRMRELVRQCDLILADDAPDTGQLSIRDVADLQRCVEAWATVQSAHKMHHSRWRLDVMTYGVFLSNGHGGGFETALEAVEEVRND